MIPAHAQEQVPSHAQPLPQGAAAEDEPSCEAVTNLQSQIDSLQTQLFHLAVARQMALPLAGHYVSAPTLTDINTFRNKQVGRFKEVYEMLPNRLEECLLCDVIQHVTRFIFSQPWVIENLETLRWMLAVESVVSDLFPAISLAASQATNAESPSTCAASDSLGSGCLTKVSIIEAAPLTSISKLPSTMPSNCSAAYVIPASSIASVGIRPDPGACRAADCVSFKREHAARFWTIHPAPRKVSSRCKLSTRQKAAQFANSRRHRLHIRFYSLPRVCAKFVVE